MFNAKALIRPKTAIETFIASLLIWNPLIAGAFNFVFGGVHEFLPRWAISTSISEVAALQCFFGVRLIHKLEAIYSLHMKRPTPVHTVAFNFGAAAVVMPFSLPLAFYVGGHVAHHLHIEYEPPDLRSYRVGIGFGLVMAIVFFLYQSRMHAREAALAADAKIRDLENLRLRAQLSALSAEMNPHLLFNALNTVASLVHNDPDRAEEVIVQLADLYRGVLRSAGASTHSLADELRLCDAYLQVEKARFGDRLTSKIEIDEALDPVKMQVPVLFLQPFVENAVKHGFSKRARGGDVHLELRMRGQQLDITVDDDGIGYGASTEQGTGKGIANCRERLRLTYGEQATLDVGLRDGGGTRVRISVPAERNKSPR